MSVQIIKIALFTFQENTSFKKPSHEEDENKQAIILVLKSTNVCLDNNLVKVAEWLFKKLLTTFLVNFVFVVIF